MNAKESKPFYHTSAWKRVREMALIRDGGLCQDCLDAVAGGSLKKVRRAEMVHHIIPLEDRPDLALELSNLRSLCSICHAQRHPEKGMRGEKRETDPGMRVIKI